MKTVSLLRSLGFISCLFHGLSAAEKASTPADILFSATRQFLTAGNYSWTSREGDQDRLTIRRARPSATGKTQIDGFTLYSLPGRPAIPQQTEVAALGKETAYKLRGTWRFYSEVDKNDREDFFIGRIQSHADYLRPLPHEVLAFALAGAKNIRKDANDIIADILVAASVDSIEGYLFTGRPISRVGSPPSEDDSGSFSLGPKIELRVGIENERIVEFTLDFNPTEARVKGLLKRRYFWEISDIGTTTLKFEPGVDVMLKTLRELSPVRRR